MSIFRAKKLDLGCFYNIRTIRDHTKRKAFEQFEPERKQNLTKDHDRQALRYMIRNTTLPARVRAEAQLQLAQMHCYTRPTQIRNRCIMGGQGRGILSDFKMSRYQFRVQAMAGNIPGVKRASW
ncbi:40S ribosomal protein mrp2, mitochondrial [Beauveria asiatica]|uniref:40S ribosomal protein mrp2, mitochondrial n=1 Tax=Beauveria asiatica TaxID=1069075 RepID=A0AAW0RV84_9HYPO